MNSLNELPSNCPNSIRKAICVVLGVNVKKNTFEFGLDPRPPPQLWTESKLTFIFSMEPFP